MVFNRRFLTGLITGLILITLHAADISAQSQPQNRPQNQSAIRTRMKGQIVNATTGEGVAYATVSIVDSLGVPLVAWATDGKGVFDHEVRITGRYTITAGSLGFDRSSKDFDIVAPVTDIGQLQLSSGGIEIEGVVVTAAPPLVKAEIDKITYNVTADPEAPVNTLLDMLRKVPLLSVDAEDNVLMQGQSNYKVLVNGKSSSMMDRSFKEVIRSMPAGSIKNIEVITNPSSRYEAEGIGGIINIITNRGALGGFNGSLNLMVDNFGSRQLGGFLNATTGKFSVSGYLAGIQQRRPGGRSETFQENFLSDDFRYQNSRSSSRQNIDALIYQLQASYEIDSLNLLTLSLMGQNLDAAMPGDSRTTFTNAAGATVRDFTSGLSSDIGVGYLSGNLDYQRLFRKPDRVLTASYKISADKQDQRSLTRIDGLVDYPSYLRRSIDDARFREHTLQLDYVEPITKKHSIESGVKLILRQNNSDPETYDRPTEADPWVFDPNRRNALDYDQYILGLYGAYTFKLQKFSAKVGARLEHTWNDGMFRNAAANTPFLNRQFNLIPNVTLSYAPKPSNRYSLSYTQRLSRPGIWYLNPYVNDIDPMNISFGNPGLEAEVGHTFNATYGIFGPKTNINISAGAMFVGNAIERIATADANGVTTSSYYNIGRNARYNLNVYYSWRPSGKFSLSMNASGNYADLESGSGLSNSGFAGNGNFQTRVALWKGGAATANVYYSSPRITLQGSGMSYYYYGMGLSQQAFNQKVTFTLSTNMPFHKDMHYSSITEDPTFYRRSETWSPARTVRFNASWNFGKTQVQVKRTRRSISNDDQKAGESTVSAGS
jgi:outer membrane receptor protein involved in Fe transport